MAQGAIAPGDERGDGGTNEEQSLRGALERAELRVLYQPIWRLDSGRAVGVEALARWRHPTRGMLVAGDFIPVAETTGLVVPIGELVLGTACAQLAAWTRWFDDDTPFSVSANLSVLQVLDPEFVETVERILRESGLAPARLCLEITESVLMRDPAGAARVLGRLKELGVGLVIDDFGTGYSSLLYLRGFPVDALKIDRSFVEGMTADPRDRAIVQAVVSLAHALGITTVAEGVEHEAQLEQLKQFGCDYGQGFYWSEPLAAQSVWGRLGLDLRGVPQGRPMTPSR